jgi:hypothetical protein
MCNLYSLTKGQVAIIAPVRAMRDCTGNLEILVDEYSVRSAPRSITTAAKGYARPSLR